MKASFRTTFIFFLAVTFISLQSVAGISNLNAQTFFSGRGIPDGSSETSKSGWLSGKSSSQSTGAGFRLPWSDENKPNNVVEPSGGNAGLFGLPRPTWMQPRDPNAPTLMEQASERSKAFWGRTQEGFSHFTTKTSESFKTMNQNLRTATSESWSRMTGNTKDLNQRSGEVKPPIGDNESWLNKNKDR